MVQQLAFYQANESKQRQQFSPLVPSLRHTKFFFVRGFEKSGTSWLRDLVGLHPAVFIARWEFHFEIMTRALSSFTSNHWQAAKPPFKQVTEQWWLDFIPALLAAGVPEGMKERKREREREKKRERERERIVLLCFAIY